MIKPLPIWLMRRYSLLWVKFKDKRFNNEQATKNLPIKERMVSVILSEMRKAGWLEIRIDPRDARKRLHKLKARNEIVKEIVKSGK